MFCSAAPPQIGVEEGHRLQRELVADLHEDEVMTASQLEVKSENCASRHHFLKSRDDETHSRSTNELKSTVLSDRIPRCAF